eukprot:1150305-Pelagomonas_calceolata.AAC.1
MKRPRDWRNTESQPFSHFPVKIHDKDAKKELSLVPGWSCGPFGGDLRPGRTRGSMSDNEGHLGPSGAIPEPDNPGGLPKFLMEDLAQEVENRTNLLLSDLVANPRRLTTWERLSNLYITAIRCGIPILLQTDP